MTLQCFAIISELADQLPNRRLNEPGLRLIAFGSHEGWFD